MNKIKPVAVFLLLFSIGLNVAAEDEVRYIYARKAGDADLVYVADGNSFSESEIRIYLKRNSVDWPKDEIELRIIFDGEIPIAWWNHSQRSFRFLGFDNVRCYGGSIRSGRAVEIREVGPSISLPDKRW